MSAYVRPNIYEFLNYREFISVMMDYLKLEKKISARQIHRRSALKSSHYLTLVIRGERKLSLDLCSRLGEALELNKSEESYLEKLVELEHESLQDEQEKIYQELKRIRESNQLNVIDDDFFEIYSSWYHLVVLEGLSTSWGNLNHSEMAESLGVSEENLKDSLQLLERLGLAKCESGKWIRTSLGTTTPKHMNSLLVRRYHKEMSLKAIRSIETLDSSKRELGSMIMPLSEKAYLLAKKRLWDLRQELAEELANDRDPSAIYYLNIQLFPLVQLKDNEPHS